ncbi:MAG: dienelactone hydrolase family protein [Reyranellaceae bacterium]
MQERKVRIATRDGSMGCHVFRPDGIGPFPPVIFYMDAPGLREELRDMARRIASVGYCVLLPDLYYRSGEELNVGGEDFHGDETVRKKMWNWLRSIDNAKVVSDTEALLRFIDQDRTARTGSVGCVGYCMSGQFVFAIAAAYPQRFAAIASIYGAGLMTDRPDSPHLAADRIRGEIYFACAEIDAYFPPEKVAALDRHLAGLAIRARVELYPGAEHGFAFPQRHCYDKLAAERHWERLFDLFRRNL